jgi:MOSC domain-containing protein YiiM
MKSEVVGVSAGKEHSFSKSNLPCINLIENFGVEGDAHAGKTIQHLFLLKKDPSRKNIRQVHLIPYELFAELGKKGFAVSAGQLGENITTKGVDLLSLPEGARLHIGKVAVVELTALRNPCIQIDRFQKGLLKEVVDKDEAGNIVRRVGVMGVVIVGGVVNMGDKIEITLPNEPHLPLEYVW